VVEHEIDARARDQGGELFEELQGLEEQVAGAVGPRGLERQADAAVAGEPETVLGHWRAQEVAAELLEPGSVSGRHTEVGVEVEAVEVRLAGPRRSDPGGLGVMAEAPDAGPGAPAQRDPPVHGGGADPGEGERFVGERIRRGQLLVALQPSAPEQASTFGNALIGSARPPRSCAARRRQWCGRPPREPWPSPSSSAPGSTAREERR